MKERAQIKCDPLYKIRGVAMIKFDRLFDLFEQNGITTYKLRKDKIVGNETLRKLKANTGIIDTRTIDRLCDALECQPGDFMEYISAETKEVTIP
jgi:putative transcriptional regulator